MPKALKLKLAVAAGIGSDHLDLDAIEHGVTIAEVTYCNSISVAEHVVTAIFSLVRNYIPSWQWVVKGGWNIADCVQRSYDLEGMHVGTVAARRIGRAVLERLKPFDVHLHCMERHRLPAEVEQELGATFHEDVESLVTACDVITINAPLNPETRRMFDSELIGKMKRGACLVNTARGLICDRDAVARARERWLAGYAGDVWYPQPATEDHPWRSMPHHGMTPHISASSLSAQARSLKARSELARTLCELAFRGWCSHIAAATARRSTRLPRRSPRTSSSPRRTSCSSRRRRPPRLAADFLLESSSPASQPTSACCSTRW